MILDKVMKTKPYRIRRFKCASCDYSETIFAGGTIDTEIKPKEVVKAVKKMFDQEEKNRENL
jgi:transposase-like protein